MQAKTIEQPVDPALQAEQQQAQLDQAKALQNTAAADTSNLMARYGTRLALAGSGITPTTTAPAGR